MLPFSDRTTSKGIARAAKPAMISHMAAASISSSLNTGTMSETVGCLPVLIIFASCDSVLAANSGDGRRLEHGQSV